MPKITSTYEDRRHITVLDPEDDDFDYLAADLVDFGGGRFAVRLTDYATGDVFAL